MSMKDFKNLSVIRLSLYTLVSLFICLNVVMLPEESNTGVDESGLLFVKILIVIMFVVLNIIGWTTTLPEKDKKN